MQNFRAWTWNLNLIQIYSIFKNLEAKLRISKQQQIQNLNYKIIW